MVQIYDKALDLYQNFNGLGWVLQVFIVILITLVLHYVINSLCKRLKSRIEKSKNGWDDALFYGVHKPVLALLWVLGLSLALHIMKDEAVNVALFDALPAIRQVAIIAIIVWGVIRFIRKMEEILIDPSLGKKAYDQTTINALSQILRAAVIITAILVTLQSLGFKISGILTLGGVGGIILGFAAKDMLANFFGGLMIYFDKPFKVGDWVRSPDRNIEGTVEQIGWRLCRIRTFDQRPLYVPNALFSTISVENPSRMTNRRIYTNIGLRYDDATKVNDIIHDVKKMLQEHPEIDQRQTTLVNLTEFAASSLNFMVYTFTKTTNWARFQEIQQDVFLKVIDIIDAHGAQCAFPTTTLHVPNGVSINPSPQGANNDCATTY